MMRLSFSVKSLLRGDQTLNDDLAFQIKVAGLPEPEREVRWHPRRKFMIDFCWREYRLLADVQGGEWQQGHHTRGQGYIDDCEKLAEASLLGWRYLFLPGTWVKSGKALQYLERALR